MNEELVTTLQNQAKKGLKVTFEPIQLSGLIFTAVPTWSPGCNGPHHYGGTTRAYCYFAFYSKKKEKKTTKWIVFNK